MNWIITGIAAAVVFGFVLSFLIMLNRTPRNETRERAGKRLLFAIEKTAEWMEEAEEKFPGINAEVAQAARDRRELRRMEQQGLSESLRQMRAGEGRVARTQAEKDGAVTRKGE